MSICPNKVLHYVWRTNLNFQEGGNAEDGGEVEEVSLESLLSSS